MYSKQQVLNLIKQQAVLPLFYHDDKHTSIAVVNTLYKAGIRSIEYTNRGTHALDNFKALVAVRDTQWPEMLLGIGTIKTVEDAKAFVTAGADFIICPGVIPAVAEVVHAAERLWIPGCMTSTEIIIAEQHGASLVKLFPGNLLGPSYVCAVKEIFPNLFFMPTGGVEVTEENMAAWFNAGVCAVGLGSKLISKDLLKNKDYDAIETLTRQALVIAAKLKPF